MGAFDKVKKLAEEAKKKTKVNKVDVDDPNVPQGERKSRYYDKNWHWEDKDDLKDTENIIKHNMEISKSGSKTGGTNAKTGEKIPASHYQRNYDLEVKALKRVRNEINTRKKMDTLTKGKTKNVDKYKKPRKRDEVDDYLED